MGYLYYRVSIPKNELARYMKLVRKVEVGETRLEEFRKAIEQEQFSQFAFPCREDICGYSFKGRNELLHKMGLAPLSVVESTVSFKEGIASEIYVVLEVRSASYEEKDFAEKTVVIRQSTDTPPKCPSRYRLTEKHFGDTKSISGISIAMDGCVTSEDRLRALSINAGCLSRVGGCKSVQSILPAVFSTVGKLQKVVFKIVGKWPTRSLPENLKECPRWVAYPLRFWLAKGGSVSLSHLKWRS
jgi:hypothetical protein